METIYGFTHTEMTSAIQDFATNGEMPGDSMMEALGELWYQCEEDSWHKAWIDRMSM